MNDICRRSIEREMLAPEFCAGARRDGSETAAWDDGDGEAQLYRACTRREPAPPSSSKPTPPKPPATPSARRRLLIKQHDPGLRAAADGHDKGYDTAGFVAECRRMCVTPHVASK